MIEDEIKNDELLHVVPVSSYVYQSIISSTSPFVKISFWKKSTTSIALSLIVFIEKLIGIKLYVYNDLRELFFFDSRIRTALIFLLKKGIISSWARVPIRPDQPFIEYFRLALNGITLPNGVVVNILGSQGEGVGGSVSSALIPAIAEALERYSVSVWDKRKLIRGSYNQLKQRGAVILSDFTYFSSTQLQEESFSKNRIDNDTVMNWISAKSFLNSGKCIVPAHLVYLFHNNVYRNDKFFFNVSTNGAAAGSSYSNAVYGAICELVERDGLMSFWLNRIAPPSVDLNSIPFPKVNKLIKSIASYNLELHILDITTDLSVPSFCAVMIDKFGGRAVSMSAVAGYDIEKELEKLLFEIIKFAHDENFEEDAPHTRIDYSKVSGFKDRKVLWARLSMVQEIDFFLQGKKTALQDLHNFERKNTVEEKLQLIKEKLINKNYSCYVVEVSSKEAKKLGLYVVRVIIPNLVPVYFKENERPLGVKRLYDTPELLGYEKGAESKLNIIPHPFV